MGQKENETQTEKEKKDEEVITVPPAQAGKYAFTSVMFLVNPNKSS